MSEFDDLNDRQVYQTKIGPVCMSRKEHEDYMEKLAESGKKIAVLFPGVGYRFNKPLLYYSKKLAIKYSYEIIQVPYKHFPSDIRGDEMKMRKTLITAANQTEKLLSEETLEQADELLFISKSIGTVIAAKYAAQHHFAPRQIYFTPLDKTFEAAQEGVGIAFHGTADPWAENEVIEAGCRACRIPLVEVPDGNHSLETGDVQKDLTNLARVMAEVEKYIANES